MRADRQVKLGRRPAVVARRKRDALLRRHREGLVAVTELVSVVARAMLDVRFHALADRAGAPANLPGEEVRRRLE